MQTPTQPNKKTVKLGDAPGITPPEHNDPMNAMIGRFNDFRTEEPRFKNTEARKEMYICYQRMEDQEDKYLNPDIAIVYEKNAIIYTDKAGKKRKRNRYRVIIEVENTNNLAKTKKKVFKYLNLIKVKEYFVYHYNFENKRKEKVGRWLKMTIENGNMVATEDSFSKELNFELKDLLLPMSDFAKKYT